LNKIKLAFDAPYRVIKLTLLIYLVVLILASKAILLCFGYENHALAL